MKTILVLVAFLITVSCGKQAEDNMLPATEFESMLNHTDNKIILDVRTPEEFEGGHIAGAMLMNIKDDDFTERINALDKSKTIFVYCGTGVRGKKASDILADLGFKQVYNLDGGLKEWKGLGKEIVN